jgi:7-carboxy-7-deazaguanine synthase
VREHLKVVEIFKSIQGESTFQGLCCTFVRLSGCNLRCTYCDTYAYEGGTAMPLPDIMNRIRDLNSSLVEITGGEPLIQESVYDLLEALLAGGFTVLLETNGSISLRKVPPGIIKIMDMKCPGSAMDSRNLYSNIASLGNNDEIKFVLSDAHDYQWAMEIIERYDLREKSPILFSPVHEKLRACELAEWILRDRAPVRLNLQLHRYIWGNERKR